MACDLSLGRAVPCKDVVGGIKAVYFVNYGAFGDSAIALGTDDEVTNITGTFSAFKYELKGASALEQAVTSSRENGTTFFEQTLTLQFTKMTKEDNKQIKLMAYGRPRVFVEDYNGNAFLVGKQHGSEVTGGTIVTGTAMGDLNGYTLTLSAQEVLPANFVDGAVAGDPFDGLAAANATIVTGANS
jgi:hypothetical protein